MNIVTIKNKKVLNFNWKVFCEKLKKMIVFFSKITISPINADRWEELIYVVLKNMKKDPGWDLGSHKPGADLWTKEFAISAKSGNIQKDHLVISSFRLTRFADLKEMIEFIDSPKGKNYDFYLCCARKDRKDKSRNYRIFLIDVNVFKAKDLEWKDMYLKKGGSHSGWRGTNNKGVKVEIRKKMSNQLWMYIPLGLCDEILNIAIEKNDLWSDAQKPLL